MGQLPSDIGHDKAHLIGMHTYSLGSLKLKFREGDGTRILHGDPVYPWQSCLLRQHKKLALDSSDVTCWTLTK